jgi:hypothetical protein
MADHLSELAQAIAATTQQLLEAAQAELAAVRQELEQERESRAQAEKMITNLQTALRLEQERREMAEQEVKRVHDVVAEQLTIAEAEHEAEQEARREALRLEQRREEERQREVLVLRDQLRRESDTRRRWEQRLGGLRQALIELLLPVDGDSDVDAVGEMFSERLEHEASSLLQR